MDRGAKYVVCTVKTKESFGTGQGCQICRVHCKKTLRNWTGMQNMACVHCKKGSSELKRSAKNFEHCKKLSSELKRSAKNFEHFKKPLWN